MSVRIIEKDCRVEDGKLIIVVEGENPEEVLSPTAKTMAIQKAASFGYPRVGFNGQTGSYPVDANGNTHDDWNDQARRGLIAAYRNEIKLMGGL
jgi:hypothetical protein